MTTPKVSEVNILTGETIVRDMTDVELAQYEADQAEAEAQRQAEADRAALKTATLAKLGLTADEVAALLS
jgi:hypothetical protein